MICLICSYVLTDSFTFLHAVTVIEYLENLQMSTSCSKVYTKVHFFFPSIFIFNNFYNVF